MTIVMGISSGQIKAIHALVGKLGWDDDLYRQMLQDRHQVTTCKALSHMRAAFLIDELQTKVRARGNVPVQPATETRTHTWPTPTRQAQPGGTITEKQQRFIERLFYTLRWDQDRRDGLCVKILGKPWPQSNGDVDALLKVLLPMTKRHPGGYDREKNRL